MRSLAALALALFAAVAPGCRDGRALLEDPPTSIGDGRVRIDLTDGGRTLVLRRDGVELVRLDGDAFELGVVPELEASRSYDPWEVERRGDADSGVTFVRPTAFRAARAADGRGARVELDFVDGLGASVTIAQASDTRFSLTLAPAETAEGAPVVALARVRVRTTGDAREGFYGLGEHFDSADNRGKLRAMQIEPDGEIESAYNEAHVPVPLLVGTRGWAMFVPSRRVGTFDVARKDPAVIEATFAVAPLAGLRAEELRVELFAADAPLDLFREYYAVTGAPRLPPAWALGPLIWRDENRDQAEVLADIAKIRELDLATSGVWIDRPYATAVNTFDFDPKKFPDPQAMIAAARAAGLRLALWSTPYLEAAAEPLLSQAKGSGYFPKEGAIPLNKWGPPIDFTNPDAFAFWRGLVGRYTAMGIEGFKLDYGEDIVPSIGGRRNVWRFADGSDERTMHHGYSALYHRAYAEAYAETPFLLCRAAHWGEQTLGLIVWPGDLDATFTRHREPFKTRSGEDVVGVGGLPASVVAGISLAASGFPFFGADTGGYRHSPPDRELFVRWAEQTALSTVMQVGDSSSQPPWVFTPENGRDDAAVDVYRAYARLHLRLFPYEWTHAHRMLADGRPIQRALGLAYPEMGRHPSDEYLFGDDLLVAPVVSPGARTRRALVPPGTWIDWWDASAHVADAEGEVVVDAPLEKLPLFAREGAIVPMLRPTIDTLSPADDPSVDSFARSAGALWARIFPGPARRFDLWDGASVARAPDGSVEVAPGTVFASGFVLELVRTAEPREVSRDGGAVLARAASLAELEALAEGWTWDPALRGTLHVKLPPSAARVRLR